MVNGPLTVVSEGAPSASVPLPTEVREQSTAKTSVYTAGQLVYDGATGKSVEGSGGLPADDPGNSLNELLKWSIAHSDPAELERRAAAGAAAPSRVDQEVLDVLLGQPTVAKMRECLGKLEEHVQGGEAEAAAATLEELEFYCESIDDAADFAKIGGFQALLGCAARHREMPEAAEAACGVLAACMQNHEKLQEAAMVLGVPDVLVRLLAETQPPTAAAVRRKVALLRLKHRFGLDTSSA